MAKIKINSVYHIERCLSSHGNHDEEEETLSSFAETLLKWHDLNCSDDFEQLKKSFGSTLSVQTLPQVVMRKEELITILKDNLKEKDNKALGVTLELVTALAQDLRLDFYPYFDEMFELLVDLVKMKDPEILERVFMCFVYLFKTLSRYIVKDIEPICTKFAYRLLNDFQADFIRLFAAQSFAFLVRKVTDTKKFIEFVFELVSKNTQLAKGIGFLFFEVIKGVKKQFHSCTKSFLGDLLRCWTDSKWADVSCLDIIIKTTFMMACQYTDVKNAEVLWEVVLGEHAQPTLNSQVNSALKIANLVKMMLEGKNVTIIVNANGICAHLTKVLQPSTANQAVINENLEVCASLLSSSYNTITVSNIRQLIDSIFVLSAIDIKLVIDFTDQMSSYPMFERDIVAKLAHFYDENLRKCHNNPERFELFLTSLTNLVLRRYQRPIVGRENLTLFTINMNSAESETKEANTSSTVPELLEKFIAQALTEENAELSAVWCSLKCLLHVRPILNQRICFVTLREFTTTVKKQLEEPGDIPNERKNELAVLFNEALFALIQFEDSKLFQVIDLSSFLVLLK